jgi:hypothetical protein
LLKLNATRKAEQRQLQICLPLRYRFVSNAVAASSPERNTARLIKMLANSATISSSAIVPQILSEHFTETSAGKTRGELSSNATSSVDGPKAVLTLQIPAITFRFQRATSLLSSAWTSFTILIAPAVSANLTMTCQLLLVKALHEVTEMWMRNCPVCCRELRKRSLAEMLRCFCGWVWGNNAT